ncbi:MAG: SirB2 family protein [Pseudomonadota bacterium]
MDYYSSVKWAHICFALLSLGGFLLRGGLMLRQSSWLGHPLVRNLPHLNDTLLLLAGVWLLWQGPWVLASSGWLQLKLGLLLLYIGLGFIALRRGRFTRPQRAVAWVAAVWVYLGMLWLAHSKPAIGF